MTESHCAFDLSVPVFSEIEGREIPGFIFRSLRDLWGLPSCPCLVVWLSFQVRCLSWTCWFLSCVTIPKH